MRRQEWLNAHCTKIGRVSGSTGVGFGPVVSSNGKVSSGMATVYVPGKTGYQCDDGQQYWE